MRVSYHTARRKHRTVCPHKELQSAFISFIASERMRYKSLRTDKRKTAEPFFASRLKRAILKQSAYYRIFTVQKTELYKSRLLFSTYAIDNSVIRNYNRNRYTI